MIFAYTYIYPNNFNLFVHPLTIKVNKKNLLKKNIIYSLIFVHLKTEGKKSIYIFRKNYIN